MPSQVARLWVFVCQVDKCNGRYLPHFFLDYNTHMVKLQVYIADDCWSCQETRRIVADVTPKFPGMLVEFLDMRASERPDSVFAVPTYLLNGRVISLGNPTRQELSQQINNELEMAHP